MSGNVLTKEPKVKYKRTVALNIGLANELDKLNLKGLERNQAFKFIRLLTKRSKELYDNNDSYNVVEIPSKYLLKVFGGKFNKMMDKLVEAKIILRTDSYSTKTNKCKKYQLNNIFNIYYNYSINDINYTKYSNMFTLFSKEYEYTELLSSEASILTENFRETASLIYLDFNKLSNSIFEKVNNLSIKDFKTNEQIIEEGICFGDPSEKSSWRKKSKILKEIEGTENMLIKDGKKFEVTDEKAFIDKKKQHILESHFGIIRKLERGEYFASRNTTNNRLDTNFTSMPSYLLEVIKKDNNLVEIDLCNSQFAIFTLICDLQTEDYLKFKEVVLNCDLYEYIQEELGLKDRDEAKQLCFTVLFSDYRNPNPYIKKFKELFPSVIEWINKFKKENGSNKFSITLQKKEAEIFIDNIYEKLKDKYFMITKHDSIICRKESKTEVTNKIQEYFNEIGFEVCLR